MSEILSLTIPFFAAILLGSLSSLKGWFTLQDGRTLSRYVFFVVLPPFMFVAITSRPVTNIVNLEFLLRYEAITIFIFLIAVFLGRVFLKLKPTESGLFGLNAAYPNYGYIGVPLALLAFGPDVAVPMALILVSNNVLLLVLTSIFTRDGHSTGLATLLWTNLISLGRNPLLLSVLFAVAFSVSGLSLPAMPDIFLKFLAGAAAPTALFALGITLVGQPIKEAWAELSLLVLMKLLLHPLLIIAVFLQAHLAGNTAIDVLWIKVAVLFTCLPIAANAFAMSEYYGTYSGRSATAIMLTTLLASVSVPAFLYLITVIFGA
ncbi:MAG: AEC family transporter [Candidatus Puniceispirillaceae bacterium]